ncbi:hypothetical protein ACS15_2053 [Ralstonia insidiosa]|uniref:Uncharacterized protein n=1 Tax=Ralstonia insidiosa TaxID=190721 RepID=A0AAC9BIH3_9RALS|nr:hypothetical protein ACS15_2053 [Ralstonia insidiosa]
MNGKDYAARKRPRNCTALWHNSWRRANPSLYGGYSTSDA